MITDDELKGLMRWGYKIASKFAASYGDTIGSFEAAVASGLTRAWKTYDPTRGLFVPHAKHVIKQEMQNAMRRSGPLGYRFDQEKPDNHVGAPIVSRLSTVESEQGHEHESGNLPIGWEIDYHDFVESIAKDLPKQEQSIFKMTYLDCRGAKQTAICSHVGLSDSRVSYIQKSAIRRIRKRLGVTHA